MLQPGTGDGLFAHLPEWRIRRIAGCPRTWGIDHPHRAVAVNPRHDTDMRPVLAGVKVGAKEEHQIARPRADRAEALADGGVVLQLASARQADAN